MTQMKLRGAGLDFVVLDECAFMKPQTWAEVIRPALTEKKGSALFISTPKGYNFFEKLYSEANLLDDWVRFTYPTHTNPIIDHKELESAKQEIGSFLFAQEYEAQFIEATGGLFKADWFEHYSIEERISIDKETKDEYLEVYYKYKDKECRLKIAVDTQLLTWQHQLERVLTSRSSHQLLSHLKARFSYWTLTEEDWKHLIYCHYYEEKWNSLTLRMSELREQVISWRLFKWLREKD